MNDIEIKKDATNVLGFWLYLMTDFVLFASLFAVFVVLRANTFGAIDGGQIFNGPFVLTETLTLLISSFICGISLLAAREGSKRGVLFSLFGTALLGLGFIFMEMSEFARLIASGNGPDRSGFLSAYFTLVGTHGLHVIIGLLWVGTLMFAIHRDGLTRPSKRKLVLFSLFWHFLDIIWIFIFTIVYLLSIV
jgi:cytochrome o ubiquinol oxidase subunit 3